jgi:hypothetical protein
MILSECKLQAKERLFHDHGFHDAGVPVWRQELG